MMFHWLCCCAGESSSPTPPDNTCYCSGTTPAQWRVTITGTTVCACFQDGVVASTDGTNSGVLSGSFDGTYDLDWVSGCTWRKAITVYEYIYTYNAGDTISCDAGHLASTNQLYVELQIGDGGYGPNRVALRVYSIRGTQQVQHYVKDESFGPHGSYSNNCVDGVVFTAGSCTSGLSDYCYTAGCNYPFGSLVPRNLATGGTASATPL